MEVRKRECTAGDPGSILRSGRIPVGGNGNPFQYSCLENTTDQSLAGYSPWGCMELDMTEGLTLSLVKRE